ncbi:pentapeptide repeat-containing protein [Bifidobacterium moukalabense]|uniref:pentapeptide repeat-containing protein n=1 Tax=Bifidobacterium moukalabense TaxID=1333651 RepID=UPI001FCEC91E|nr:pentapeptide repeat-containing protein [Bifidobacterium moukalabense]
MAGNKDQRKPSWLSEHPFVNIALWSVAAIVLFILFLLILGGFDFRKPTFESIRTAIDPKHVTPAIAMLGIIPATGALVLKYQDELRNRADEERKNRDERRNEFSAALERIGSGGSAMSRLAGVHTLVAAADKYPKEYQDETVRILCAYLRSYHSKDDSVIESAVLESLRNHYAKDAQPSWSGHRLDLHGATIGNPFDFDGCEFNKTVNLDGATFEQDFRLADCSFKKLATRGTIFCQDPQISDPIINESWDIRLSESSAKNLTITRGIIGKIRISDASCPLSFDACTVKSIDIQKQETINSIEIKRGTINSINAEYHGTINSINAKYRRTINSINAEYHGTINSINVGRLGTIESINVGLRGTINSIEVDSGFIESINAGRYGTIGSIGVDGGVFGSIGVRLGAIESIDIQEQGAIDSIKIQEHGHVPLIKTCGGIGSLMIYGGVDELEMTGGVIHAFYPSANNGIKKLDLRGGRVALLIKPQDFELDVQNQNRVIRTVSLMTAITAPVLGSA